MSNIFLWSPRSTKCASNFGNKNIHFEQMICGMYNVRKQTYVSFFHFNISINPHDATSGAGAKLYLPRSPSSVNYPIFSIYQNLSGGNSWSSTAAGLATLLACPAATERSVLQMTRATTPRGESGRPATRTLACHLCTIHLGLSPCHSAPGARLDSNN